MTEKTIFQQGLFESEKEAFDPMRFERMLEETEIEECISAAIMESCRIVQEGETYRHLSLKTQSVTISEVAMHLLQEKLEAAHGDVDFHFDTEGNLRSYFITGGYIFILHKDDLPDNNTRQGRRVKNQQLDKHIITIIYKLNALRSDVATIALQYWQGNSFIYQKSLDANKPNVFTTNMETESGVPTRVKPKFKKELRNVSGE